MAGFGLGDIITASVSLAFGVLQERQKPSLLRARKARGGRKEGAMEGCGGSGLVECFCAGDFCACSAQGTGRCEGCADCQPEIYCSGCKSWHPQPACGAIAGENF